MKKHDFSLKRTKGQVIFKQILDLVLSKCFQWPNIQIFQIEINSLPTIWISLKRLICNWTSKLTKNLMEAQIKANNVIIWPKCWVIMEIIRTFFRSQFLQSYFSLSCWGLKSLYPFLFMTEQSLTPNLFRILGQFMLKLIG